MSMILFSTLFAVWPIVGDPVLTPVKQQKTKLDALVPHLLEKYGVPAVGIAVANREGVLLAATYGQARPGVAADEGTLFNVASVTKMLSAETILRLSAREDFDLDQAMAPTWVDPDIAGDPRSGQLTPRHALAHQTGFPNWRSQTDDQRLAFRFDPGTRPGYSGEGFEYVARFAEKITRKSFPELVRETVLTPARIDGMVWRADPPLAARFAWSQNSEGIFGPADTAANWSAADDLYATPKAFARFLSTLIGGKTLPATIERDRRRIQFDMTQQFCSRETLAPICPEAIGFGLSGVVFQYPGETVLWQGGGDVGERAVVFFVPERNIGVVIFTNGANGAKLFAPIAELFYNNEDYLKFLAFQATQG